MQFASLCSMYHISFIFITFGPNEIAVQQFVQLPKLLNNKTYTATNN